MNVHHKAVSFVIRPMKPKDFLGECIFLTTFRCRNEMANAFIPAFLGHQRLIFALKIPFNFIAARAAELKQFPHAVLVRHIEGAIGDGRENHKKDEHQNYKPPSQSL